MIVRLLDRREVRVPIGDVQTNRQQRVAVLVDQSSSDAVLRAVAATLSPRSSAAIGPLTPESARCSGDKPNFFTHATLQRIGQRRIPGLGGQVPSTS